MYHIKRVRKRISKLTSEIPKILVEKKIGDLFTNAVKFESHPVCRLHKSRYTRITSNKPLIVCLL
jgi:hypothetical protein